MSNQLTHYGVQGMKWGVRRYQDKNGRLTSAGKKRYYITNPSDKDLSEYHKQKMAEAPSKAELPNGANKGWWKNAPTSVVRSHYIADARRENAKINTKNEAFALKKGSRIYRVTSNTQEENDGRKYATFKEKDRQGYIRRSKFLDRKNPHWEMTLEATEDLFSPSKRERIDAFISLMQKDPKFSKELSETMHNVTKVKSSEYYYKRHQMLLMQNKGEKAYNDLAIAIGFDTKVSSKYFTELANRGYNMIVDDADASALADTPIIIFDGAKSLTVQSKKRI